MTPYYEGVCITQIFAEMVCLDTLLLQCFNLGTERI